MGKGPVVWLTSLVTISPSATTICFPAFFAFARKGLPVNCFTESITVLGKRLLNKELNLPSSNTATGIYDLVKLYRSSSDCKLLSETTAGEGRILLLESVDNKMVFCIPLAITVSMLEGNMGNTLSKLAEIGLGVLEESNG